jgi:hypothetical protein
MSNRVQIGLDFKVLQLTQNIVLFLFDEIDQLGLYGVIFVVCSACIQTEIVSVELFYDKFVIFDYYISSKVLIMVFF